MTSQTRTQRELEQFSRIVDRIYQGATEPGAWIGVLEEVAAWLDAPKALLFTPQAVPEAGGFMFTHGFEQRFVELWATRFAHLDLWLERAIERGLNVQGVVAAGEEFLPAAELEASRWYREFLSLQDVFRLLTSIVFDGSDGQNYSVVCSLYRGYRADAFGRDEKYKQGLILPHISRALGVMFRLQKAEFKAAAGEAALDRIACGVVLIGADRMVTFANRAARRMLAEADGLALRASPLLSRERLSASDAATQGAIEAALGGALDPLREGVSHFAQSVKVARPSGRLPYALQFSTLAVDNEFGHGAEAPRAIVFINDPDEQIQVDPELLRKVYGLTPAEIRVAVTLCQEGSVDEAANKLGVSANTVKTQLQQVYQKTDTDNRGKLTKLIVSLAAAR